MIENIYKSLKNEMKSFRTTQQQVLLLIILRMMKAAKGRWVLGIKQWGAPLAEI